MNQSYHAQVLFGSSMDNLMRSHCSYFTLRNSKIEVQGRTPCLVT